jgi:predicted DNA-binding protein (MmcQ/YjbR family)
MNIEELRKYCLSKKGSGESFPFDETTLVFKVMNKMFAITDLEDDFAVVIKADPQDVISMREQYPAVKPPRYFDKRHWNLVLIDGSIDAALIKRWIDESYDLIVKKLPKKDQKALGAI